MFESHQRSFKYKYTIAQRGEHRKKQKDLKKFNTLIHLLAASLLSALASSLLSLGNRLAYGPSGYKNSIRRYLHRSHLQIWRKVCPASPLSLGHDSWPFFELSFRLLWCAVPVVAGEDGVGWDLHHHLAHHIRYLYDHHYPRCLNHPR